MDQRVVPAPADPDLVSPYRVFSRDEWAHLRADTPLTLSVDDLTKLQSINDPISLDEIVAIYLPLSRLLSLYVAATCRACSRRRSASCWQSPRSSNSHHRRRRLGRRRQVDDCARAQGAALALAEHAEGRTRHHRWLSCRTPSWSGVG